MKRSLFGFFLGSGLTLLLLGCATTPSTEENELVAAVRVSDEASFVMANPKTGRRCRIFHMDIVEMKGRRLKVRTAFGDAAAAGVALGLIQLPVPPPPRSSRTYPVPDPKPTGRPIKLRAAYPARCDGNGLATRLKLSFDSLNIMRQLGLEPALAAQP